MATATIPWRVGAFADRYPRSAMGIGRALKEQASALRLLYATAGVTSDSAITDSAYSSPISCPSDGPPVGCCGAPPCPSQGVDSACSRGTCDCASGEYDFAAIYPDAVAELDNAAALGAAIRDILTDPDVDDVGSAIQQATAFYSRGRIAALYAPAVPAKPLPSGAPAPARCPICGAAVCAACGCGCSCVMSEQADEMPAGPAGQ